MHTLLENALSEAKDLFMGYLWNRIPKGERLLLGSLFLRYVSMHDCKITVIHTGESGQQWYMKS